MNLTPMSTVTVKSQHTCGSSNNSRAVLGAKLLVTHCEPLGQQLLPSLAPQKTTFRHAVSGHHRPITSAFENILSCYSHYCMDTLPSISHESNSTLSITTFPHPSSYFISHALMRCLGASFLLLHTSHKARWFEVDTECCTSMKHACSMRTFSSLCAVVCNSLLLL